MKCIYTGTEFSQASGEHVLQNFLGARWTSNRIVCNEAQELFGRTIDAELEKGLREFRVLLGTKGGRRDPGPALKRVLGSKGTTFHLLPGGTPVLAKPVIKDIVSTDGTVRVDVKAADIRQLAWAIAEIKKKYPRAPLGIKSLKTTVSPQTRYTDEKIHLRSGLGGKDFFRGALKSAFNLLGVTENETALSECCDSARNFVLHGIGHARNHVRWLTDEAPINLPCLGEFDQFLGIYARDGSIEGYVQFFGEVGYLLRLSDSYQGPAFCHCYTVDPLRESMPAELRSDALDMSLIPSFAAGRELPSAEVLPVYLERINRLLSKQQDRAIKMELGRIIEDMLLPHEGEILTEELLNELSNRVAFFFLRHLPGTQDLFEHMRKED
jgi:hypothetical protein